MTKTIKDQVSGVDVTAKLITTGRNAATITICANGILLTETVRGADLAAAKRAYAKRDIESFGSFFNGPSTSERKAA